MRPTPQRQVLCRLRANTDPQWACGTIGSKLGIDAAEKLTGEGFKGLWPPLITMDEAVKRRWNNS